ncbi:RhoGEF domain containing protein [Histomonas meleagridis]|uniref:RhoGEF domain containing protein n=1 Tax=Histomonas meleagridis TaxID=135588 RepID=UPI003559D49C|nr:RhoGEF domain containing protein [Histomonas meleagridis]KAH0804671.1 RhoGEF domain containing protein [Histomonas meleagridis]
MRLSPTKRDASPPAKSTMSSTPNINALLSEPRRRIRTNTRRDIHMKPLIILPEDIESTEKKHGTKSIPRTKPNFIEPNQTSPHGRPRKGTLDSKFAFSTDEIRRIKLPMTEVRAYRIITRFIRRGVIQLRLLKDTKRRSIVRELIETERNYVDSLQICQEVYYKPLDRSISSKSPLIDTVSIGKLFGNMDEICEAHRNGILSVMDEYAPLLRSSFPPHEIYVKIANAFTELLPRLGQLYSQFLSQTENSDALLKKLNKNRKFNKFLREAIFNPRAKCQEIEDLLILPTQRIAGYKLLFERILKYFPSDSNEYKAFNEALTMVHSVGETMNAEKSDQTSQSQLLNIAESVSKIPPFISILKPGRKFIGQYRLRFIDPNNGNLLKHSCIFLMSDILLIARKHSGKMFSRKLFYIEAVPLTQVRLSQFPVQEFVEKAFVIKTDTHEYNFYMKSNHKRNEFLSNVKKQKKEIVDKVRKQTQEGFEYMVNIFQQIAAMYDSPKPARSREKALESLE